MDLAAELKRRAERVEQAIDHHMPPRGFSPERLNEAMRYSMSAGGKRLRPVMVAAAAELFDPAGRIDPLPAAVAVECVHTYSLIHDDLPCMDDDDFRRGRPTLHKAFDEATAVLGGDALLTLAFQILAHRYAGHPELVGALVRDLGDAAGYEHLIAGQVMDLQYEHSTEMSGEILDRIHAGKTGAMIAASLTIGARVGGASIHQVAELKAAGLALGMAFQIVDDVLDATEDSATLGKTAGKDEKAGKITFVKIHGIARAREIAAEYTAKTLDTLRRMPGDSAFLVELAQSMLVRRK